MKTLGSLKQRLEALPGIRVGKGYASRYEQFLSKAIPAKESLSAILTAINLAAPVLPSPDYQVSRKSISTSASIAGRLAGKLRDDPAVIGESKIEESFMRLTDNAGEALKKTQSAWQNALQAKIKDWELIAEVVARLGEETKSLKAPASRLKFAVDSLRLAKNTLPRTEPDASAVKENLAQMADSVSKLGLNTPFGKFLQAAASEKGAGLGDAQTEAVSKQIESLNLTNVFRVRLSS